MNVLPLRTSFSQYGAEPVAEVDVVLLLPILVRRTNVVPLVGVTKTPAWRAPAVSVSRISMPAFAVALELVDLAGSRNYCRHA